MATTRERRSRCSIGSSTTRTAMPPNSVSHPWSSPRLARGCLPAGSFGSGTRPDERLVHELLQSDFGGAFRVDLEQVFLWGGSQGTCFLNDFVPRYGEHYGGVVSTLNVAVSTAGIRSGIHPRTSPAVFAYSSTPPRGISFIPIRWTPTAITAIRSASRPGAIWREKVDTVPRGDVAEADALSWLVDGTGLDDEPEHVHLERVSTMDFAVGFASDPDGALWIARQPPGWEARLWRSIDRGYSFHPVSRIGVPISDLDAVGDALVGHASGSRRRRPWPLSFHGRRGHLRAGRCERYRVRWRDRGRPARAGVPGGLVPMASRTSTPAATSATPGLHWAPPTRRKSSTPGRWSARGPRISCSRVTNSL